MRRVPSRVPTVRNLFTSRGRLYLRYPGNNPIIETSWGTLRARDRLGLPTAAGVYLIRIANDHSQDHGSIVLVK